MTDNNTNGGTEPNDTAQSETIVAEIEEGERPSEVIVRAVATLTNTAILDLDPLYNTIDPEHLDNLTDGRGESAIEDSSISFRYNGCLVTVSQGTVRVRADTS